MTLQLREPNVFQDAFIVTTDEPDVIQMRVPRLYTSSPEGIARLLSHESLHSALLRTETIPGESHAANQKLDKQYMAAMIRRYGFPRTEGTIRRMRRGIATTLDTSGLVNPKYL